MHPSHRVVTATASDINCCVFSPSSELAEFAPERVCISSASPETASQIVEWSCSVRIDTRSSQTSWQVSCRIKSNNARRVYANFGVRRLAAAFRSHVAKSGPADPDSCEQAKASNERTVSSEPCEQRTTFPNATTPRTHAFNFQLSTLNF